MQNFDSTYRQVILKMMKKEDYSEKQILIIGAGPAGMACAMELHNSGKNFKINIIEKDYKVGGLAKTLEFREGHYIFRTDIGPHRFFSKNKYLYNFIAKLLGEKWILVQRRTRQFIDGKYYDYPVNVVQALKNLGLFRAIGVFFSFLNAFFNYRIGKKKIRNFEDYIVSNFGRKLGELNMLNYTEKIWGIKCKEIHPDWAVQRIKGLSLYSVLKSTFFKKKDTPKTLVEQFYYPQYGTGLIYETIAEKIKKASKLNINSYPTKIIHKNFKITEMELNINGEREKVRPNIVVSSIPITEFLDILNPKPPMNIMAAASLLKWRSQVYLFITLDKDKITNDNWIYFPNKEIPFGRISEMKNFSKKMSPENKTSLFVEFFVNENDAIWEMTRQEIFDLAIPYFEKLRLFSKNEVRNFYVFKKEYAYPVYDLYYLQHLKVIKDYLNKFENLIFIGRPGRFQYTNQDHSLEMGILAARSITENKKYNFDDMGLEKEYLEKGRVD